MRNTTTGIFNPKKPTPREEDFEIVYTLGMENREKKIVSRGPGPGAHDVPPLVISLILSGL